MNIFAYVYISLLGMCLIMSLFVPLNRAKPFFFLVTTIFSLITILSIFGMVTFLVESGLYPEHRKMIDGVWVPQGDTHFSWLVLAGIIMFLIYLVPMFLRPRDFLQNFVGYTVGLLAYIALIPLFANVFSIYSMCNLHDISWGNRPTTATTTGTEAFSANLDIQKKT